jgi:hypothetical protein
MPTNNPTYKTHSEFNVQKYTSRYTPSYLIKVAAVLRDISEGTSYQTVRLVFRPYTHLTPSSCTSERLKASSELSSTFTSNKYSSLSFGSYINFSSLSTIEINIISLVRVSRRVKSQFPSPSTFSFCTFCLFTFRSLYFFAIGH